MRNRPHNPYMFGRQRLKDPSHRPKLVDVRSLVALVDWQDAALKKVCQQRDDLERENDKMRDALLEAARAAGKPS